MNPFSNQALVLLLTAAIYARGWVRIRRRLRSENDAFRLASFLLGLLLIFIATDSPLDAFDKVFLSAHMAQHLLLMMRAPPLLLLGAPTLPMLRGLPRVFVKEALGPFLTWPVLEGLGKFVTSPPFAWIAFTVSTVFWHIPACYELAVGSQFWHGIEHASFFWTGLLFWWPLVEPAPYRAQWPAWTKILYLLASDLVNTAISATFVFSGRQLYPSYHSPNDQVLAGLIMWVPGSIVYLVPAFVLVTRLFSPNRRRPVERRVRPVSRPGRFKLVQFRRPAQILMLLIALYVVIEGWRGPQVAALNPAGVLPWIHWRALSVFALLVIGNLFCFACPFTFVRDLGRRVLPANRRWPRALRNKWLATGLFAAYLVCYEVFSLWNSPFATAWIIVGYFAAALTIDGLFRGASFCKYVCPIGQFHFVSSLISPREIKVKSQATCQSCRTHDCIRGNTEARGCELYLFQPKKDSSLDCTFCLDCVKACPHDNVALLPVLPAQTLVREQYRSSLGRLSKRTDLAALALVFVCGAFANAAAMVSPVMMWEHRWHARLGPHAMPYVVAGFMLAAILVVPAALLAFPTDLKRRLSFTLVPLGFSMWAAHLLYHFATVLPGMPDWLTGAQILLLDAGLLVTLAVAWKIRFSIPWTALSFALYSLGIWVLFQPMQMRGMLH